MLINKKICIMDGLINLHTHTHTHTHIYFILKYIFLKERGRLCNKSISQMGCNLLKIC